MNPTPPSFPTVRVLNVDIHNVSRPELFPSLTTGALFTPNVDFIMKMNKDREFHRIFHQAEFRICDSQIVLAASRFLGTPLKEKISGSDFFGEFCVYHRDNPDIRIFLLGAGPGVAEEARARVNARIGREIIIAAHSPSFGFEKNPAENDAIIDLVNRSNATVLTVGVGAPKQEKWIMAYRDRLPGVRIFLAVGATIDFEAGNIKRAPRWMSQFGLESIFRILQEPKRLWRRYFIEDLPFLWYLLKQKLGFYRSPF